MILLPPSCPPRRDAILVVGKDKGAILRRQRHSLSACGYGCTRGSCIVRGLFVHVTRLLLTRTKTRWNSKMADSVRPSRCYKYADKGPGQRDDVPLGDASD